MINARIENTDRIVAQLSDVGVRMRLRINNAVQQLSVELAAYVKERKLSGQVLRVRTGNLRRSIGTAFLTSDSGAVGIVSTNVKYGRAHEYGFEGSATIKAHLRKIKATGTIANVQGHTRNMRLPTRSFLRSALAERLPLIQATLRQAAQQAVAGGS